MAGAQPARLDYIGCELCDELSPRLAGTLPELDFAQPNLDHVPAFLDLQVEAAKPVAKARRGWCRTDRATIREPEKAEAFRECLSPFARGGGRVPWALDPNAHAAFFDATVQDALHEVAPP